MALAATLYRFHLKISDVDRGVYEDIELRVPMHPSESVPYLVTRLIAYALNLQEGITFSAGLSTVEEPALWVKDLTGKILLWVEIGNPSARRLHKAAKASPAVRVYTYRDLKILQAEMEGQEIHRREHVEVFTLPSAFLKQLGETLERDNRWELLHTEGELSVTTAGVTATCEIGSHRLGG